MHDLFWVTSLPQAGMHWSYSTYASLVFLSPHVLSMQAVWSLVTLPRCWRCSSSLSAPNAQKRDITSDALILIQSRLCSNGKNSTADTRLLYLLTDIVTPVSDWWRPDADLPDNFSVIQRSARQRLCMKDLNNTRLCKKIIFQIYWTYCLKVIVVSVY